MSDINLSCFLLTCSQLLHSHFIYFNNMGKKEMQQQESAVEYLLYQLCKWDSCVPIAQDVVDRQVVCLNLVVHHSFYFSVVLVLFSIKQTFHYVSNEHNTGIKSPHYELLIVHLFLQSRSEGISAWISLQQLITKMLGALETCNSSLFFPLVT